jgi:hypothetical protein
LGSLTLHPEQEASSHGYLVMPMSGLHNLANGGKEGVAPSGTGRRNRLARDVRQGHNRQMRALAGILVAAAILFGVYEYYLKTLPTTDEGTASTQAISLTGVRADLLQIAQAERNYTALNGHCATLDELLSSNALTMTRAERDGYSYSVECAGSEFTVSARHAPAPSGSPIRYPVLAIDQNMQVREAN